MRYFVRTETGDEFTVDVDEKEGQMTVTVDGEEFPAEFHDVSGHGQFSILLGREALAASIDAEPEDRVRVVLSGVPYRFEILDERQQAARVVGSDSAKSGALVRAPMPGVVVSVEVEPGQSIQAGEPLLVLEAMKMQNEVSSERSGVVEKVEVQPGQAVENGATLVLLGPLAEES